MVSVTRRSATSEHQRLGRVHRLVDVVGHVVAELGDLAGDADEPPQQRVLLDDPGVAGGVGRGRRRGLEVDQGAGAADGLEQAGPPQLVGDGDGVGRLALGVERGDGVEDVAVGRLVEVVDGDDLDGRRDGVARQQHGPEQRLLGLEVVGRDPARGRSGRRLVVLAVGSGRGRRSSGGLTWILHRVTVGYRTGTDPGDNRWGSPRDFAAVAPQGPSSPTGCDRRRATDGPTGAGAGRPGRTGRSGGDDLDGDRELAPRRASLAGDLVGAERLDGSSRCELSCGRARRRSGRRRHRRSRRR